LARADQFGKQCGQDEKIIAVPSAPDPALRRGLNDTRSCRNNHAAADRALFRHYKDLELGKWGQDPVGWRDAETARGLIIEAIRTRQDKG